MKHNKLSKKKLVAIAVVIAALAVWIVYGCGDDKPAAADLPTETKPTVEDLRTTVSTTGTVEPKNRLEVMPSVAGRIESILVNEGDSVKTGKVLALMSSTERAALIDAARLQGQAALNYWKSTYNEIQIVAPISGTVIVRNAEPGQTVNTSSAIIVISDRLIVKAQVDETDIAKVKVGQEAETVLDSHPELTVPGKVSHIHYESVTVNNVTVYNVEITPNVVPDEFRSGMSATVDIIQNEKKNALTVPIEAVTYEGDAQYVTVKPINPQQQPEKRAVKTGITAEDKIEITEGLAPEDTILVFAQSFNFQATGDNDGKTNPFMPRRSSSRQKATKR